MKLSVLALSSRFDGRIVQFSHAQKTQLSVLALSSRFDGRLLAVDAAVRFPSFSTRSVESF